MPDPSPKTGGDAKQSTAQRDRGSNPSNLLETKLMPPLASTARQLQSWVPRPGRALPPGLLQGAAGLGMASGPSRELRTEVRGNGAGMGVFNLLRFVRDQLGVDSSRDGRVGGPAFHFRWSPRSLSGPQGPRERVGGRGLGAGSGRGRAAAAAGLFEPVPGSASPRGSHRPTDPQACKEGPEALRRGRARCLPVVRLTLPLPSV